MEMGIHSKSETEYKLGKLSFSTKKQRSEPPSRQERNAAHRQAVQARPLYQIMKGLEEMSENTLKAKVTELKELKAMQDELAAEITAIEDEIKAEMLNQGTDEITVDIFKIRYKLVKSKRFDSSAFKATHAELYNQYTKTTATRRFSVA